jgi:hypothetical protein
MEARTLLSTCTVIQLTDSGQGSGQEGDLRYCINKTNSDPGEDRIEFQPGLSGAIKLTGVLPDLSDDVILIGPGADRLTIKRSTGGSYRIFNVASNAAVHIEGVTVTGGAAQLGGGIYNAGELTVRNVHITRNSVTIAGAGVFNSGVLKVEQSSIGFNFMPVGTSTGVGGGGIFSAVGSTTTVFNSSIYNNRVRGATFSAGGGIYVDGSSVTVSNSTIAGNFCSSHSKPQGGGIWISSSGSLVTLRNTIVASNAAGVEPDIHGVIASFGHNLIGNTNGSFGFSPTDLLNVDSMLRLPADNGGATPTLELAPGSPAIDAGDNTNAPPWDQRGPGFPRVVNGTIDIGAFEVQAATSPNSSHSSSQTLMAMALALAEKE